MSQFLFLSEISEVEVIASGHGIRSLSTLQRRYGRGRWRKLKGVARIELADETRWLVELHWYEAHGVGRRGFRVKRWLSRLG